MNALEEYLAASRLDPIAAMNQLQDAGIISDNCVSAGDVADGEKGDCLRAVKWLKLQNQSLL